MLLILRCNSARSPSNKVFQYDLAKAYTPSPASGVKKGAEEAEKAIKKVKDSVEDVKQLTAKIDAELKISEKI